MGLKESGIRLDHLAEIHSKVGQATVMPVQKPKYTLEALLAQKTPENRHDEVKTGKATGAEPW